LRRCSAARTRRALRLPCLPDATNPRTGISKPNAPGGDRPARYGPLQAPQRGSYGAAPAQTPRGIPIIRCERQSPRATADVPAVRSITSPRFRKHKIVPSTASSRSAQVKRRGERARFRFCRVAGIPRLILPTQAARCEKRDARAQERRFPHVVRDDPSISPGATPSARTLVGTQRALPDQARQTFRPSADPRVRRQRPRPPTLLPLPSRNFAWAGRRELGRSDRPPSSPHSRTNPVFAASGPVVAPARRFSPRSQCGK